MKCNITEQLDAIAVKLGAEVTTASNNIMEALQKISLVVTKTEAAEAADIISVLDGFAEDNGYVGNSSETISEAISKVLLYVGGSSSGWDLSDRIEKGQGTKAVIIGQITTSHAVSALGTNSIACGDHDTIANGYCSFAEGYETVAHGVAAHSMGKETIAHGNYSVAEGLGTSAKYRSQHVFGEYNIIESTSGVSNFESTRGTYVEIVGNGEEDDESNARTLDWNGNEKLAGSLTLGMDTENEVTITATQLQALLALLN